MAMAATPASTSTAITTARNGDRWLITCSFVRRRTASTRAVSPPIMNALWRTCGRNGRLGVRPCRTLRPGEGLGPAFADYDDDGFVDVYVANDSVQSFLYRNEAGRRCHRADDARPDDQPPRGPVPARRAGRQRVRAGRVVARREAA